jgi:hypothetical protein
MEELVAELESAFICADLKITPESDRITMHGRDPRIQNGLPMAASLLPEYMSLYAISPRVERGTQFLQRRRNKDANNPAVANNDAIVGSGISKEAGAAKPV